MAEYVALKRLQVCELNPDGSTKIGSDGRPVMRWCMPGDPAPEAATWKNLDKYVRTGSIGLKGLGLTGPGLAETIARQRNRHPEPTRKPVRRRRAATAPVEESVQVPEMTLDVDEASVEG